jgi:hypothetical protein
VLDYISIRLRATILSEVQGFADDFYKLNGLDKIHEVHLMEIHFKRTISLLLGGVSLLLRDLRGKSFSEKWDNFLYIFIIFYFLLDMGYLKKRVVQYSFFL